MKFSNGEEVKIKKSRVRKIIKGISGRN